MTNNQKMAVQYFKRNRAFHRAFQQMKKQWEKYGRITGTIKIPKATEEEKEVLEGFLGTNLSRNPMSFSFIKFEQELNNSKFGPLDLRELMELYFDVELETNKLKKEKKSEEWAAIFCETKEIIKNMGDDAGSNDSKLKILRWIELVEVEKNYGYSIIAQEFNRDPCRAKNLLLNVSKGLMEALCKPGQRLSIIANNVTSYPHDFDKGTLGGNLLLAALSNIFAIERKGAKQDLQLYIKAGVIPDDISSFTAVYGINFFDENLAESPFNGLTQAHEAYIVSLMNLGKIQSAQSFKNIAYIVENQMVFSQLVSEIREKSVSIICTSGQIRSTSLYIIEMLLESGSEVYYSGDYDPEGLQIADGLIKKYPKIKLWHYSVDNYQKYEKALGSLSDVRLNKLDKLQHPTLNLIGRVIKNEKKPLYQESFITELLEDLLSEHQ